MPPLDRSPESRRADRAGPSGAKDAPLGVLLVNLGSPAAPTRAGVRAFLAEFLGDPLVVDLNPLLWWAIRNWIVLPFRSGRVARAYRSIWMPAGSPLLVYGRLLEAGLRAELGSEHRVVLGMRYGKPSLRESLIELRTLGCEEVLLVPLFPQYSRSTTGSIELAVEHAARALPDAPLVRVAPPYFAHPGYIEALAAGVRESLSAGPVDHVVFSLHGLPVRYVEQGDPYRAHCEATAGALARALDLAPGAWSLVYQSRFGREPWLEPAAEAFVPGLAARAPRVLVAMPGFVADCLETLEEIGERLAASFRAAGGRELRVVPCLNDHPAWIRGLARIVRDQVPAGRGTGDRGTAAP